MGKNLTEFIIENIRLKELILVVNMNRPFFDEFIRFIREYGYSEVHEFIAEKNDEKVGNILKDYFNIKFTSNLYDGIARPYDADKSKWFFITWLLRDAPTQRLQPMISSQAGANTFEKRITILNKLIKYIAPLMPDREQWQWHAIAEVFLQRLEGSRRALKGGLLEAIVRTQLVELFAINKLAIEVTDKEVKLNDETYDVEVIGQKGKILLPVKTRETMGGGHSLLFTRDIHKAITVAADNGYNCIPIIIAESWHGKLEELNCKHFINIKINPNQLDKINPLLKAELQSLISIFSAIQ
jgi:hypothetical protein